MLFFFFIWWRKKKERMEMVKVAAELLLFHESGWQKISVFAMSLS